MNAVSSQAAPIAMTQVYLFSLSRLVAVFFDHNNNKRAMEYLLEMDTQTNVGDQRETIQHTEENRRSERWHIEQNISTCIWRQVTIFSGSDAGTGSRCRRGECARRMSCGGGWIGHGCT